MLKKIKYFFIIFSLILANFCQSQGFCDEIEDILLSKNVQKAAKITPEKEEIKDELLDSINSFETALKLRATKFNVLEDKIQDELINSDFITKNSDGILNGKKDKNAKNIIEDDFIKKAKKFTKITKIRTKTKYDFTKKQIPILIKIDKNFKADKNSKEGQFLSFFTIKDFTLGKNKLPKGTKITGRVETISSSDKMGVPESVVVDNFFVDSNPNIVFYGSIKKTGANRSIWVYPLYQAGNFAFYVAGFVFVPIHGGHARFSTNEVYTVYYETLEANI